MHTLYYPLCSHLTLTPTACNNTIVIVANTIILHTPLLLCLTTFPTYYSHFLCIAHTFLSSSTPLSYVWPIPYYLNRRYFYDPHTLRPYLIFLQLLFNSTHKYDTNRIDFASHLLHSHIAYIRSIPFHSFAICAILIIFSLAPTDFTSTPLSSLQTIIRHHRMSKPFLNPSHLNSFVILKILLTY